MTTQIDPAAAPAGPSPDPVPSRPAAPRGRRRSVRPLALRLHFYAGILVAPLLVVACVTGLLYVATPQLEPLVYRHELRVDPPAGARPLPLVDQIRAARAAHPEGTIATVRPAPERDATTRVVLDVDGLPEARQRTVFVDPYRGEVRGALLTSGEWLPLRAWVDELHRHLHLGETGRLYSETAAAWLWVVVLGGLVLWFGRGRAARRRRPSGGRGVTVRRHAWVGVVAALGLLALSATGLTWSKHTGDHVTALRQDLNWQTPAVDAGAGAGGEHAGHAGHGEGGGAGAPLSPDAESTRWSAVDDAVRTAGTAGLVAPLEVTPPATDGARWAVKEVRRTWPERQDAVAVNAGGTRITDVSRFADWPLAAKLARWGVDAHMGLLFGIWNQLALAALAIALLVLIVLGYRMWWQRRPKGGPRLAVGRPVPRGTWRQLPTPGLVLLVAAAALAGWFIPPLGVTLVAFLLLDGLLALVRRRRPAAR
ncbi:PepSY domain-containing protein [Patulibacter sp. SYSU D01012]|uniref:PepSY-associated TM helix domain-containing protein n=1 Tax=Patulibacter sp. SYSU D01012 TaxID=2817381 RepID=UPI001B3078BF|nr:PepSY domain-containing protein [Patulibacter sp. SYSU D01012]